MSTPRKMNVARILGGILTFQLVIAGALVLGDLRGAGWRLPGFQPDVPRLTEPVRPGDQRRRFSPARDRPATQPLRDPGTLPDRLTLTPIGDGAFRLEGDIAPGDAERMLEQITQSSRSVETLVLQSPGGSVSDALKIGRYIRQAGIETRMLRGEFCFSACPYILAGGASRDIEDGAQVGVHQHFFGQSTVLPAAFAVEDIQMGQAEVMRYLDDMGIDPMLAALAMATPPDEIYVLLPEELVSYGFNPSEE